jgi:FemAB-related protein (PEP-CTERM system-associated)
VSICVEILKKPDPACDVFVAGRPDATIAFLYAWAQAVSRSTGVKSFYLVARDNSDVQGILPLSQTRSFLFGNRLVSQAFSMYGGILAQNADVRDALFNRAVELAKELRCESIEFRNVSPLPYDLHMRTGKICMHLPLSPDPQTLWNGFDPKVRNQVRKAEKSNLAPCDGGLELLDEFYAVYSTRVHQLGTPAYSRSLMKSLLETFPNECRIFAVKLDKLTLGAGFITCFNGFVEIQWAGTFVEYNKFCPNNLLYWSIIQHYCLAGARCFDFGRCTVDGPTYQFKKQWGPTPVELHYQYWTSPGHKFSIATPENPKYKRKVELWKKLPLGLAQFIGPHISKNLP